MAPSCYALQPANRHNIQSKNPMPGQVSAYNDIRVGDIVRMRKPHPCGSQEWAVVRIGADIGIRCAQCSRRVLLPRSQFLRQVKALVSQGPPGTGLPVDPFNP